jgi:hypothetical protein
MRPERTAAVVPRHPDAETHVGAQLKKQPLNLSVRRGFLYHFLFGLIRSFGLWDCDQPDFRF